MSSNFGNTSGTPATMEYKGELLNWSTLVAKLEEAEIANYNLKATIQELESVSIATASELETTKVELVEMTNMKRAEEARVSQLEDILNELIVRLKLQSIQINNMKKAVPDGNNIMIGNDVYLSGQEFSKENKGKAVMSQRPMAKRMKQRGKKPFHLHNRLVSCRHFKLAEKPKIDESDDEGYILPPVEEFEIQNPGTTTFCVELNDLEDEWAGYVLSNECVDKLIHATGFGNRAPVYINKDSDTLVTLMDILAIPNCAYISNAVLDAYGIEILKSRHSDGSSVIINSNCWTTFQEYPTANPIYGQLYDAVIKDKRQILFPMCSNGQGKDMRPMHWSLMVYDIAEGSFKFYNSCKPKIENTTDPFMADANIIRDAVDRKFTQASLNLFAPTPHMPTISVPNLPQQEKVNDCAIFVCYFMKQIVFGRDIEPHLAVYEVTKLKTEVMETIALKKHVD